MEVCSSAGEGCVRRASPSRRLRLEALSRLVGTVAISESAFSNSLMVVGERRG